MSRQDLALAAVDRKGRGLEIGPSFSPLAPKAEGFDVDIVDHLDQKGLVAKYKSHGVDVSRIEPVDFVWSEGRLGDLLKRPGHYDYVIASHVIEHLPDPLGFLSDVESLLKSGGVLVLVVPDKRYCFDYLKPVSTTGQVIDASFQPRATHTPGAVLDHVMLSTKLDGAITWNGSKTGELRFAHQIEDARNLLERAINRPDEYLDIHRWHFTPSSLKLILLDLRLLKRTSLLVVAEHETVGCEFFLSLRKAADSDIADSQSRRFELAQASLREQSVVSGASVADRAPLPSPAGATRWFRGLFERVRARR